MAPALRIELCEASVADSAEGVCDGNAGLRLARQRLVNGPPLSVFLLLLTRLTCWGQYRVRTIGLAISSTTSRASPDFRLRVICVFELLQVLLLLIDPLLLSSAEAAFLVGKRHLVAVLDSRRSSGNLDPPTTTQLRGCFRAEGTSAASPLHRLHQLTIADRSIHNGREGMSPNLISLPCRCQVTPLPRTTPPTVSHFNTRPFPFRSASVNLFFTFSLLIHNAD